jgi:hypothetical protein
LFTDSAVETAVVVTVNGLLFRCKSADNEDDDEDREDSSLLPAELDRAANGD